MSISRKLKQSSILCAAAAMTGLSACVGPMDRAADDAMREQVVSTHRELLKKISPGQSIPLERNTSEINAELSDQRKADLDKMSGQAFYQSMPLKLDKDLTGGQTPSLLAISLQQAIETAVRHNLEMQQARMLPGISQTQVTQAQATFDAVFFSNYNFQRLDDPRVRPDVFTDTFKDFQQAESDALTTGIRQQLITGGKITAQTSINRTRNEPATSGYQDRPEFYTGTVELTLEQPLLRNFGTDVNRAQIVLAQSGREQSVYDLTRTLMDLAQAVEQAYWRLYAAHQQVKILQRLLDRAEEDYKKVKSREGFDVNPIRKTQAGASMELRRTDVLRAREELRASNDALKRLINDSRLVISGEEIILPTDEPADVSIEFNLLDAITTALRHRPEAQKALLLVKDASVRLRVADNSRLPLLNMVASARSSAIGLSEERAYTNLTDNHYIDYILQLQFEQPIGNRAAEGLYEQRILERQALTLAYQRQAQDIAVEIKNALRKMSNAYRRIESARTARRASADNLRAIEKQEEAGVALTPEFLLDLKLGSQQRLAESEREEIQALIDYNNAVTEFHRATGTLLDRDGIVFQDPQSTLPGEH